MGFGRERATGWVKGRKMKGKDEFGMRGIGTRRRVISRGCVGWRRLLGGVEDGGGGLNDALGEWGSGHGDEEKGCVLWLGGNGSSWWGMSLFIL